jgi:NAD(P)-dependent dehydrogenase (short-subunit alcohol dehydrogenase family)
MNLKLESKVLLVTGGTRGIGELIVRAIPVIIDRDAETRK